MRLVNIDDCNEELFYKQVGGKDSLITAEDAFRMLKALPISYNLENVVEELEREKNKFNNANNKVIFDKAIEIVKGGGK